MIGGIPRAGRLALRFAFVAAGLAFVVRAAVQGVADGAFGDLEPTWLVAGFVAALAGMTLIAARWSVAAALVGGHLPVPDAVPLYFQGEIGKYIPGSVWAVLGRGELARRAGMTRSSAYASVVTSLIYLYLGAGLTAAALLPVAAGARGVAAVAGVLMFLVAGLVVVHPAVIALVVTLAEKLSKRRLDLTVPRWGQSVRAVIGYVPAWVCIGAAHWFAARALNISASYPEVLFGSAVAWSAGFLAIPAPGGIGIRESVFVLTSGLAGPDAAAAALLARVLFVLADGLGAVVGAAWMTRRTGD